MNTRRRITEIYKKKNNKLIAKKDTRSTTPVNIVII